ncbi:MAG: DNA-processing protein DprA [Lachnospiraceae bacterium]|nr:DNA-processing protein DprA [Lachnospiraceae bacterium]
MIFENAYKMDPCEEARNYYRLAVINDISLDKFNQMQNYYGSLKEVFAASEEELRSTGLFTELQIAKIRWTTKEKSLMEDYERMLSSDIRMIPITDREYPVMLKEIKDPPLAIFLKGELPGNYMPVISVIGARRCTGYGESVSHRIGELAGASGIAVVSGMARGIDSMAQIGAVEAGGYSLAVLGGGVDVIYPKESLKLYRALEEKGGILSEFPPGTQPLKPYFAMRNRLISGLSDAVCVIEAKEQSGTLITVDCALDQGREVYAVPGRICDHTSFGTNELIRQGATVVSDVQLFIQDVLKKYGIMRQVRSLETKDDPLQKKLATFSETELKIIANLDEDSFTLDMMGEKCGVPGMELLGTCLMLTEQEIVVSMGAGRFKAGKKGLELKHALEKLNDMQYN